MDINLNKANNLKIAYIGGGSKSWAWSLMCDLALEEQLCGTVHLYDIDYKSAWENSCVGNQLSKRNDVHSKWRYETAQSLEESLIGADFVVISILPGSFEEMRSDVHLPEEYGIYQSVGDSVGPAGLMRALRTIPIYKELAIKIKQYCPDAWVINYTNPMTLCTRTLYAVYPDIKAFGCCHGVFETQELLEAALKDILNIEVNDRKEIKINVLGINHFTWINEASYKNIDLIPVFMEFAKKYWENGYELERMGPWDKNVFSNANRVIFDLSIRYGIIAASPDRHIVEFLPPWYLKDPETVKYWKFHLTPVDVRIENGRKLNEMRKRVISGEEKLKLKPSGEEGVAQMKALLGLDQLVTNVNIPNYGQMQGIPADSIIETNAIFGRDSIKPIISGKLPNSIHNLVIRHVLNLETILYAALAHDKEAAFHAFINDPLVTIEIKKARELFERMLVNINWD